MLGALGQRRVRDLVEALLFEVGQVGHGGDSLQAYSLSKLVRKTASASFAPGPPAAAQAGQLAGVVAPRLVAGEQHPVVAEAAPVDLGGEPARGEPDGPGQIGIDLLCRRRSSRRTARRSA